MGTFEYYLLIVNGIGFLLYLINMWLYSHTAEGQVDKFLTILSLAGGSAGILLAILFVIQVVILLMVKGHHADTITFAFWKFFTDYKVLLIYFGIINFVAFVMFAIDKVNAAEHRSRIRIVTLLGVAFIGGSVGGLMAMYLLHHKTKKDYFTVGIPLIMIMQVVVAFYILNAGW